MILSGMNTAMSRSTLPTIMLIDDHDLYRAGLRTLLEAEQIRVLADTRAELGHAVLVAERTHPDIVLIDIDGAGRDTSELIHALAHRTPGPSVIVLTRSLDPGHIYRAIRAGARGYVTKETGISDLAGACRAVHAGQACMSPQAASAIMEIVRTGRVPQDDRTDMSEREIDVLRLLADGLDNNQIAESLSISAKTVKNHVSSIFAKLGLNNRVQAAVYAVRSGIV